jgi:putative transposase
MARFRDIKTLQKFASVQAAIYNHFNLDCHLNRRDTFKHNRAGALAEWHQLATPRDLARSFCFRAYAI